MKTNKDTWEDKLRKELGEDSSRFPLPENYFETFKGKVEAKVKSPVSEPVEEGKSSPLGYETPPLNSSGARGQDDGFVATTKSPVPELAEGPEPLTANPKPLLKWVYLAALPIAAALAFFILNRETIPVQEPINQELMSEAAEGFYKSRVEEVENLDIDSQTIVALASNQSTETMQEEVLYDEYEYEALEAESEEVDPLDDLDLEDIEDYLVENININSEL